MKLFPKLLLMTALVGLVPLVAGGVLLIRINTSTLDTTIREGRLEMARARGLLIEDYLDGTKRNIATVIYERDLAAQGPDAQEALFRFVIGQYESVTVLAYVDAGGTLVARAIDVDRARPGSGDWEAFLASIPTESPSDFNFSPVRASASGDRRLSLIFPYFGKGVVVAEVSLTAVKSIVEEVRFGAHGGAFLVDADGRSVTSDEPVPAVAAALSAGLEGTGEYVNAGGNRFLESHQPIDGPDWMLFIHEPEADAFAASNKMRTVTLLLVAGSLILAMMGGLLISRRIVGPVHRLLAGTREVAAGKLDHRVERSTRDEIGDLTSAFNEMAKALDDRERSLERLDRTAKVLLTVLEPTELIERTAAAVQETIDPSRLAIYLSDGETLVARRTSGWTNGASVPGTWPATLDRGVLGRARRGAVIINEAMGQPEFRDYHEPIWEGCRHLMCVPVSAQDRLLGFLCMHERRDGTTFTPNDARFVEIIAAAAGASLSNVRLLNQMIEKSRMQTELQTAEVVQRNLLPQRDFHAPGLELAAFFQSASETGGDWYGYLQDPVGGAVSILIGDVTGHGVSAALVTATTHSFFKTIDELRRELGADTNLTAPAAVLRRLNHVLWSSARGGMTMSFFVSTFDPETGTLTFANAGHTFPYYLRRDTESKEGRLTILSAQGPRLGEQERATYEEQTVSLSPGDSILWYTDGLVEATDPGGAEFDRRRLRRLFGSGANRSCKELRDQLARELESFRGGEPLRDDVTFIVGRVPPRVGLRPVKAGLVLAVDGSREFLEPMSAALAAQFLAVRAVDDVEATVEGSACCLGVLGADAADTFRMLKRAGPEVPCGVVLRGSLDPHLADIAVVGGPLHFFSPDESFSPHQTAVLLRAMIDRRPPSIRELLRADPAGEWIVHDSRDRGRLIRELVLRAAEAGADEWTQNTLRQSVAELLANAFMHAPGTGTAEETIILDPRQANRLTLAVEDGALLVSVRDAFGSLGVPTLLAHLRWSHELPFARVKFDDRRRGAGLGLAIAYRRSRGMIVSIEPGRGTEIVLRLSLKRGTPSEDAGSPSLHVFVKSG